MVGILHWLTIDLMNRNALFAFVHDKEASRTGRTVRTFYLKEQSGMFEFACLRNS